VQRISLTVTNISCTASSLFLLYLKFLVIKDATAVCSSNKGSKPKNLNNLQLISLLIRNYKVKVLVDLGISCITFSLDRY
jgi:hypothetical protein